MVDKQRFIIKNRSKISAQAQSIHTLILTPNLEFFHRFGASISYIRSKSWIFGTIWSKYRHKKSPPEGRLLGFYEGSNHSSTTRFLTSQVAEALVVLVYLNAMVTD